MPIGDYSGGSTSSSSNSSSNSGGGGRDTGSDYGQFDRAVSQAANNPPSAPSGGGGDNNTVDPGFQRALAEIAYQQQNPVYGDPDPQVDVSPEDRDSITSFFDNYVANVKSNPLNLSAIGALKTLYQTGQARNMMSGVPGYEFLDYTGGDGNTTNTAVGGGEQDYINNAISQLPFAMTGTTPQDSMVNQYFANQPTSSLSSGLETSYNNAKSNINNILGIATPSQQFGYSQAPYGLLSSTNMADNPYKDYLTTRGLI
jgi:hypothetical protein